MIHIARCDDVILSLAFVICYDEEVSSLIRLTVQGISVFLTLASRKILAESDLFNFIRLYAMCADVFKVLFIPKDSANLHDGFLLSNRYNLPSRNASRTSSMPPRI